MSIGARVDGNDYNTSMRNPFNQFSPRFSLSYALTPQLAFNFNTGIFYQLPPYTTLGYQQKGIFVNKDNLKYIRTTHLVGGFEYNTKFDAKFSVETYFKRYANYPFLTREQVSLANLGANFGVIGNDLATSTNAGKAYGIEFLYQQRLYKGFYGIFAYTFGRSQFENPKNDLVPSSWDSRNIISATMGYQIGKGWEAGIKFRSQTGLPYTPDALESNIKAIWDVNGQALPNYAQLNTLITNAFNTLDLRIDKKWYGKRITWNVYLDIQNLLGASVNRPITLLDRPLDADLKPIGEAPTFKDSKGVLRYKTKVIENKTGNTTPSLGLQIDF